MCEVFGLWKIRAFIGENGRELEFLTKILKRKCKYYKTLEEHKKCEEFKSNTVE